LIEAEMPMSVIVVTGVSRGLGREMALGFAAAGHTVCGCGTSEELTTSLQNELGSEHHISVVDVSSDSVVADWASHIVRDFDAPEFLINNAAVINPNAPLWDVDATTFDRLTAVNINGIANMVRHFVPTMIAAGRGVIVNFSSGWGRSTAAEVAPYCASKWAVEGLTKSLAAELPAGLAAVPLNPGIINTDMLQSCFSGGANQFPSAQQWAEAAVPFILQMGDGDNGQSLSVPGF
jgi:NAD(P)-dependent dehydrogenase (short-subunit alcohol dehydrogenase family)